MSDFIDFDHVASKRLSSLSKTKKVGRSSLAMLPSMQHQFGRHPEHWCMRGSPAEAAGEGRVAATERQNVPIADAFENPFCLHRFGVVASEHD